MPEPLTWAGGVHVPRMWECRQADMVVLLCYDAKERIVSGFKGLLREWDLRSSIREVYVERGVLGILEVVLDEHLPK